MSKPNVVFLDAETLDLDTLDTHALESLDANVTLHDRTQSEEVVSRIADAHALLVNKVVLNEATLSHAKALRYIGVTATGMNNIDLEYCREKGIEVKNVEGYGTDSVAQHAVTLLLNLATQFVNYQRDVTDGEWARSAHFCLNHRPVVELAGKHAVIVGHGALGQRVESLLCALGMHVSIAGRPGNNNDPRPSLESLLPNADVVSLHCPLTKDNEKLINKRTLSLMKSSCFLINTARGGLIDEAALLDALIHNRIGGAGLDVLSVEPPPSDHILLNAQLPNLLITPHNAWIGQSARQTLFDSAIQQLAHFLQRN